MGMFYHHPDVEELRKIFDEVIDLYKPIHKKWKDADAHARGDMLDRAAELNAQAKSEYEELRKSAKFVRFQERLKEILAKELGLERHELEKVSFFVFELDEKDAYESIAMDTQLDEKAGISMRYGIRREESSTRGVHRYSLFKSKTYYPPHKD
ncbi:MAG: hypothetical protein ABH829_02760 [archaeon]